MWAAPTYPKVVKVTRSLGPELRATHTAAVGHLHGPKGHCSLQFRGLQRKTRELRLATKYLFTSPVPSTAGILGIDYVSLDQRGKPLRSAHFWSPALVPVLLGDVIDNNYPAKRDKCSSLKFWWICQLLLAFRIPLSKPNKYLILWRLQSFPWK